MSSAPAQCLLIKLALTKDEVAAAIGASEDQISAMVEDGALPPPRKWGDELRWLPSEVDEHLRRWPISGERRGRAPDAKSLASLLTSEAAARYLGISITTLRSHVREGDIAFISMGRSLQRPRRLFDVASLEAFIGSRRRFEIPATKTRRRSHVKGEDTGYDFMATVARIRAEKAAKSKFGQTRKKPPSSR